MSEYFTYNERLGIKLASFNKEWELFSKHEQQALLLEWEKIRGKIPDRIAEIEVIINQKQVDLGNQSDFPLSCQINSEISDLASVINDLWIWYRMNQQLTQKGHY